MPDYEKMYHILCRAASSAIDEMPDTDDNVSARQILQKALYEAEEIYITAAT